MLEIQRGLQKKRLTEETAVKNVGVQCIWHMMRVVEQ
jgi:hypothetical protein